MLLFGITKLINGTVGPKLLALGLRSSSPLLLPLAQYLISIEVRDDYRQLKLASPSSTNNIVNSGVRSDDNNSFVPFKGIRNAWESFVDQTWSVLFEDSSDRKAVMTAKQKEDEAEIKARRLYEEKSRKREERRSMRRHHLSSRLSSSQERQKQQTFISERIQRRNDIEDGKVDESLRLQGEERVKQLGQYILPALLSVLSKKQQQQKQQIQCNDHFVKWIRGEYLIARYGLIVEKALAQYPELCYNRDSSRDDTTVGTNDDLHRLLPSVDVVRKAFDMQDWCPHKVPVSSWHDEVDESFQQLHDNNNNNNDSIGSQDDIIERIIHSSLNGQVEYSGPINAYFELRGRDDTYELWTKEYIQELAKYLIQRILELDEKDNCQKETTIMDVGAGDGRLVYFLCRAMEEEINADGKQKKRTKNVIGCSEGKQIIYPKIIATDDGSWKAPIYDNVERLSVVSSLEKYRPRIVSSTDSEVVTPPQSRLIVICSWMPPGQDWTKDFRNERQVEEYILIGETDDGTCGHNWLTWGNPNFRPDNDNAVDFTAPYAIDGYERINLDDLSKLQFSRFDCKRSRESLTVSFRSCRVMITQK